MKPPAWAIAAGVIAATAAAVVGLSRVPIERIGAGSAKLPPARPTTSVPKTSSFSKLDESGNRGLNQDPNTGNLAKNTVSPNNIEESPTLNGSFTFIDEDVSRTSGGCSGTGGYSDIEAGLQVSVKNEKGEIIATGRLDGDNYSGQYPGVACQFPFVIRNIPKAKFYEIEVGRRGSFKYSYYDLSNAGWIVRYSIGGS